VTRFQIVETIRFKMSAFDPKLTWDEICGNHIDRK